MQFGPRVALDQAQIYNVAASATEWTARQNGLMVGRDAGGAVAFPSNPVLGRARSGGSSFQGDIAEVVMYDRVLTDAEREAVHVYLSAKYAPPGVSAPSVPTGLSATGVSATEISLGWTAAEGSSLSSYVLQRKSGTEAYQTVATVAGGVGYLDTGLTAGTTYTYRVAQRTYLGDSAYSTEATAATRAQGATLPRTGMRLWLRADGGAGSGQGAVGVWQDQSGLGNHAVQGTSTAQPTLVAGGLNGRPVVRFDGSDSLNLPNVMSGAMAGEAFVVLKSTRTAGTGQKLWKVSSTGNYYNYEYSYFPDSSGQIYDSFGRSSPVQFGPRVALDQTQIYNVSASAAEWTARQNGLMVGRAAGQTVAFLASPVLGYGPGYYGGFQGDIAEVVMYDRVLTEAEREAVNVYMVMKYSIAGHTVPSTPELEVQPLTATSADLSWSVTTGANQYFKATVERQSGGGAFQNIATVYNRFNYTDTGLTPGQTYSYRIKLESYVGASGYSPEATLTLSTAWGAPPLSGMRLWLSASTRLQVDNTGMVWPDQSGRGNHARQDAIVDQPARLTNALNGLPVVRFDGAGDHFKLSGVMTGAQEGEAFVVLQSSRNGGNGQALWNFSSSPDDSFYFEKYIEYSEDYGRWEYFFDPNKSLFPSQTGSIEENFGTESSRSINPAVSVVQPHIYNVSASGTRWTVRQNGVVLQRTNGLPISFSEDSLIGRGPYAYYDDYEEQEVYNDDSFQGDIAEVVIYDRVLTQAERDAVNGYLNAKYAPPGIMVPAAPVLSVQTVSSTSADLTWTVASGANQHLTATVERQTGTYAFQEIATLDGQLAYTDTGLSAGQSYGYRVKLQSYAGTSAYSNTATLALPATLPAPPAAGMRLWLRATSGLQTTNTGLQWADQSGKGNHAVQATTADQPSLAANALNGRPVVRFDGNGDYFTLPNVMNGATAGEAFVVLKSARPAGQAQELWSFSQTGYKWDPASMGSWYYGYVETPNYFPDASGRMGESFGRSSASAVTFGASVALDQAQIYNVAASATEWTARQNGLVVYRDNGGAVAFRTNPVLGRGWPSASVYTPSTFQGDIAEVVMYDRVLTSSERDSVRNYLALKYSLAGVDIIAPSTPSGLAVSDITDSSFTLSWTAATDNVQVIAYDIYKSGVLIGSSNYPYYTVSGLSPGSVSSLTVSARDAAANSSAPSTALTVTTLGDDVVAPTIPTGLVSSDVTLSSMTLTWNASADNAGVVAYDVYRDGIVIGSPSAPTFSVTALKPGTHYIMAVRARDMAGNTSAQCASLAVTTLSDTSAPTIPTGLASANVTSSSVTLTWAASTDNVRVMGYHVYRDGTWIGITSAPSFTVSALLAAKSYIMTIQAYDAWGNTSAHSSALSVTTLSIPVPALVDTDKDGQPDPWELAYGLNPSLRDNTADLDGDGVPNNQDTRPNNATVGVISVTITAPLTGSVLP